MKGARWPTWQRAVAVAGAALLGVLSGLRGNDHAAGLAVTTLIWMWAAFDTADNLARTENDLRLTDRVLMRLARGGR